MRKKTFEAKITYKVKPTHPDIGDMPEKFWKDKVFTYEDTYHMNMDYFGSYGEVIQYIQNDLKKVAGGGYNANHIYDVSFEIEEVMP